MSINTVKLKSYSSVILEKAAVAALFPGSLVELTSADKVQKHSTAQGNVCPPMVALEDELQGNEISDAYAADDKVNVWIPQRGDEAYMILDDGENVAIGDFLESAGNGYLQKHVADVAELDVELDSSGGVVQPASFSQTIYPNAIVAVALEAVDLSASSGESGESSGAVGAELGYSKRIKVRII